MISSRRRTRTISIRLAGTGVTPLCSRSISLRVVWCVTTILHTLHSIGTYLCTRMLAELRWQSCHDRAIYTLQTTTKDSAPFDTRHGSQRPVSSYNCKKSGIRRLYVGSHSYLNLVSYLQVLLPSAWSFRHGALTRNSPGCNADSFFYLTFVVAGCFWTLA